MKMLVGSTLISAIVGCTPVTISTSNSINPVLFGPVRALPATEPNPATLDDGPLRALTLTAENFVGMSSDGNRSTGVSSRTAPGVHDMQVFELAPSDPTARFYIEAIDCWGWALVAVAGMAARVACTAPTRRARLSTASEQAKINLLEAISHADLASIKTMLTLSIPEGVDLDTSLDTDGTTVLMLAAQAGREDLVRFLLSDEIAALLPEPVDLTVRDVHGRTAADIALSAGHPSIAALLSARTASSSGSTPGTTPDPWAADP